MTKTLTLIFLLYVSTLVIALSTVNTELKIIVEGRERQFTRLQVVDSYPSQTSLKVVEGKGYQRTADQWRVQKALNHDGNKLVQQSEKNRFSRYQWPRNNYFDEPVQKTAQMYQGELLTAEFAQ